MDRLKTFSRLFVGIVFIFSGFVKGVDPLGTTYRIEDYFMAYGALWAMPLAFYASVFLCTLEFVLGVALVMNARIKILSWILFPLMIFFTILTFYDALFNPVPDCGCFGDFIKMTNWQTFFKNVVLIVFVYIVFKSRKKYKSLLGPKFQTFVIILFTIGFTYFSYYQYQHLPMLDFRDWKIGKDMKTDETSEPITYLIYQNKETKEKKEYVSPNFPWNDSVWMSKWEFVDQRIDDSHVKIKHELVIQTRGAVDITKSIVENPEYQFIFVSDDLTKVSKESFKKINKIYSYLDEKGISLVGVSSSSGFMIDKYCLDHDVEFNIFFGDDIVLKAMIRSNPGLIMLKDGVVIDKWHYNDFPELSELDELITENFSD